MPHRFRALAVAALVAVLAAAALPATAASATTVTGVNDPARNHFGETSKQVAKEVGCKRWHGHSGGRYAKSGGVCWVKGKRVNVLTFRGPKQERTWNRLALVALGRHFYWARGTGAVVVAKNGNRPAARIGANRLPGIVVHGF
jgi:hypothetical protein